MKTRVLSGRAGEQLMADVSDESLVDPVPIQWRKFLEEHTGKVSKPWWVLLDCAYTPTYVDTNVKKHQDKHCQDQIYIQRLLCFLLTHRFTHLLQLARFLLMPPYRSLCNPPKAKSCCFSYPVHSKCFHVISAVNSSVFHRPCHYVWPHNILWFSA